jgi:long-subunit fatty acid transport protein
VGEYVFAIGGNYNNVFQIGVSMGLQNIHYTENSTFTEASDSTELSSYNYTEKLETKGTGFNLKLGMIYRPTEFLRIGAAFHTPTFFSLKDVFSYEINSHFRTPDNGETDYASDGGGENEYSYELYTPMRLVVSTALVFAKIGIISADYEFLNYSKARLRAEDYDFEFENNRINSMYSNGHNLRLGAEIKLAPVYLRGGISYYGSPDNNNSFSEIKSYSFGIGLRTRNVFVDFGFNHSYNENLYRMYDYEDGSQFSKLSFNEDLICFTLGYVF